MGVEPSIGLLLETVLEIALTDLSVHLQTGPNPINHVCSFLLLSRWVSSVSPR
jgi:hypothetical protein